MKVRFLSNETHEHVEGRIRESGRSKLPSLHEGWRFNFSKHSKSKNARTFVIVANETPDTIEGCLIYKMLDKQPYMAFIEIAPHNQGKDKKYDDVAGCLIAFACRLSFQLGEDDFCGWLAFDVQEPTPEAETKLMRLYAEKYHAVRFGSSTTMLIMPQHGELLIEQYLSY